MLGERVLSNRHGSVSVLRQYKRRWPSTGMAPGPYHMLSRSVCEAQLKSPANTEKVMSCPSNDVRPPFANVIKCNNG